MPKVKKLTGSELARHLKASAPTLVRVFIVYEDFMDKLVSQRECRVTVEAFDKKYDFCGKGDVDKKIRFLEQAWNDYVRIDVRMIDEEKMEISFYLKG
jgi:hypothetical protein